MSREWYVSLETNGTDVRGDLYFATFLLVTFVFLFIWIFPLFFSSREMSISVKLKASGMYCIWIFASQFMNHFYRNAIVTLFFSPTGNIVSKFLIRTIGEFRINSSKYLRGQKLAASSKYTQSSNPSPSLSSANLHTGHTFLKKMILEINWQFVQYLSGLGAIDDASGFILHAQSLTTLTMYGRMMQASSDNIALTIVLELGSIGAEVYEARDLLRLDTPFRRYYKNTIWMLQGVGLMRSPGAQVVATGIDSSGNPNEDGSAGSAAGSARTEDDMNLRQRFCSDVLIATQMAEVSGGATNTANKHRKQTLPYASTPHGTILNPVTSQ